MIFDLNYFYFTFQRCGCLHLKEEEKIVNRNSIFTVDRLRKTDLAILLGECERKTFRKRFGIPAKSGLGVFKKYKYVVMTDWSISGKPATATDMAQGACTIREQFLWTVSQSVSNLGEFSDFFLVTTNVIVLLKVLFSSS